MRTRGRGDIVMISSVATVTHVGQRCAVQHGQGRDGGAGVHAREGGASLRDPRQRGRARAGGDRHGPALGAGDERQPRHGGPALDGRGAPFGRVCQPSDIANVVLWLCTDGAGYVTGQRIEVDGGGTR